MKRKIFVLVLMMIMIGGCGKSVTTKFKNNDGSEDMLVQHKNNQIEKLSIHLETPYSKLLVGSEEEAKKVMEPLIHEYNAVDGVSAKVEYSNNIVTQLIEIDPTKISTTDSENQIIPDIDYSNFREYKKELLENNFIEHK